MNYDSTPPVYPTASFSCAFSLFASSSSLFSSSSSMSMLSDESSDDE